MQINLVCGIGSTGKLAMSLYNHCISVGYNADFCYIYGNIESERKYKIETTFLNIARRSLFIWDIS